MSILPDRISHVYSSNSVIWLWVISAVSIVHEVLRGLSRLFFFWGGGGGVHSCFSGSVPFIFVQMDFASCISYDMLKP